MSLANIVHRLSLLLYLLLLSCPSVFGFRNVGRTLKQTNNIIVVDQLGQGEYLTVQDAVDAIADGNSQPVTIQVNQGTYQERVIIPASKPYITLQGAGAGVTFIEWNLIASDTGPDGKAITAYNTASVTVLASNFIAKDISFLNTQPAPPPGVAGRQAAAFRISGDRAAFYRCGFFGAQDTLCDDQGRHYFESCYIRGSIDFIFGNGRSLYKNCELNSIAQGSGSVAAQNQQSPSDNTGFSFVNCNITGTGPIYLGRAMGPYSRIVYSYCYMDGIIDPRGWNDWTGDGTRDNTVFFGQYQCAGPGADESGRVPWSHELTDAQVQGLLGTSFIDGMEWLQQ